MKLNANSLIFKIIFFGVILVFISLLTFSSIFLVNQHKKLSEQILEKGIIFSEFSAKSIYDDYVKFYSQSSQQGFSIFKERMENKLNRNEDVVDLSLVARNGVIGFNIKELETGYHTGSIRNISDPETLEMLKGKEISYREIEHNGDKAVEIIMPIEVLSGQPDYYVQYIVSFESFQKEMLAIYRDIGISFVLVFIFLTLISIIFYSNITKPLKELSNLTKKIREGDLSTKIETNGYGKDEFGSLAEDFNVMVKELKKSQEEGVQEQRKVEENLKQELIKKEAEREELNRIKNEMEKRLSELEIRNKELEKTNKFMVDRELKMIELKKELDKKGNRDESKTE